jgi:methylenetetrahydrofolate--tRNA-(uracil-5-)-methyltransferase
MGVNVIREEVLRVPEGRPVIIATGPLTSDGFAEELQRLLGTERLFFYDAIAPIVYKDSINFDIAFRGSRYGKGGDDYINCPMTRERYERFVEELLNAEKVPLRPFEKIPFFEGCLPVETIAQRGPETLAFGPLRPVGFTDPAGGVKPCAVVQLRRENMEDTIYNMVGFQTRLTYPAQQRVFRLIPGLESARFTRLGSIHRNSYIDSPRLLLKSQQLSTDAGIFFAGQITGVEGYCESAASGLLAGINAWRYSCGQDPLCPPPTTMTGALLGYITGPGRNSFQPMNANFGLLPGVSGKGRRAAGDRALEDFTLWANKVLASSRRI